MRSNEWKPSWANEDRLPGFIEMDPKAPTLEKTLFDGGSSLWGNMPAVDLINLAGNEADAMKDFSLAFVASGDLRHVMKTINSLPDNYSGKLNIMINDGNPFVFCRNIVLLLILGCVPDEKVAADIALHFWYSVFIPAGYRLRIGYLVNALLKRFTDPATRGKPFPLGATSSLATPALAEEHKMCFQHFIADPHTPDDLGIDVDNAQAEYDRVRTDPSRKDYRDRMYTRLKPSHRVAFHEYRRYGIVLPIGAANPHFNCANSSLFSIVGRWLQTDFADPLAGWDNEEVVRIGKTHGAQAEDIYGCLYFFLSSQLRSLAQRIRKLPISFKLFSAEACALSKDIKENKFTGMGITSNTRFDRIEVSNILDISYVGTRRVLTSWSSFLSQNKHAAIVGYYMNWSMVQKDARVEGATRAAFTEVMERMIEREKGVDALKATFSKLTIETGNTCACKILSLSPDLTII
ncbi:hypothetical protein MD484_g4592, partial [Candolleomyces efflorescens]